MAKLNNHIEALKLKTLPRPTFNYSSNVDLKIKAGKGKDERTIEGYLAVFGVKDMSDEICVKGCFAKSIAEHGPKSNSKYKIKMLWQHESKDPIGSFLVLKEDDYGLYFKAKIDAVPSGDRALIQIKSGTLNQFSFGFLHIWDKVRYEEKENAYYLLEVELWEGSVVTIPDNMETYAIKSRGELSKKKKELQEETEAFIKTIQRSKQYELRELITKHLTLALTKPLNSKRKALKKKSKPLQVKRKKSTGLDLSKILSVI